MQWGWLGHSRSRAPLNLCKAADVPSLWLFPFLVIYLFKKLDNLSYGGSPHCVFCYFTPMMWFYSKKTTKNISPYLPQVSLILFEEIKCNDTGVFFLWSIALKRCSIMYLSRLLLIVSNNIATNWPGTSSFLKIRNQVWSAVALSNGTCIGTLWYCLPRDYSTFTSLGACLPKGLYYVITFKSVCSSFPSCHNKSPPTGWF